jgi:hexosaminidase
MAALSEVQWCQSENKSWERFLDSADDICAIYETAGYNYAKHIFQITGSSAVNRKKSRVEAFLNIQGDVDIHYTLDGSEPTPDSPVYAGPIEITGTCTLKAKAFRNGFDTKTYEKVFNGHKAMGRPVTLCTEPHDNYVYGAPDCLTDGILGKDTYTSGDWAGWYDVPFEAVVDMNGCGEYSEVTLGTFVFKHDWIFNPVNMTISVSDDGKEFREVAFAEYETIANVDDGNGRQEYTLAFEPVEARYLKVKAGVVSPIPEWHAGAGKPGFLFVDEISVR